MSQHNPYDGFLDGRPTEVILGSTAGALASAIAAIGPERVSAKPAPGKWSPAEIVCHLADCEIAFGFRLRQTLAEDMPTLQPFDQDKWAETYEWVSATRALEAFTAFRAWNLRLIGAALPAAAGRQAVHPERGMLTFRDIVETMAGHDLNHLGQLQKLAAA
jgi:hypothetical protein